MADARTEPSMDDILASIKRIIADDAPANGEGPAGGEIAREDAAAPPAGAAPAETVLELTEPVAAPENFWDAAPDRATPPDVPASPPRQADDAPAPPPPAPSASAPATPTLEVPIHAAPSPPVAPPIAAPSPNQASPAAGTLVSKDAAGASRQSLAALASVARPAPGETSLEGLVREMLRPMLRDWLDANLPKMVETLVAREIARITAQDD